MKKISVLAAAVLIMLGIFPLAVSAAYNPYYDEENTIKKEAGTINLTVGEQQSLKSWMLFEDEDLELEVVGALTWASRSSTIAAVDSSGVVTAKRAGATTVTVTYKDNRGNTWIQSIRVKVTKAAAADGKTQYAFALDEGKIIQLEELLFPGDNGWTTEWSSNRTQVASVDAVGMVTANRFGSCTITASGTDAEGNSRTRKVALEVVSTAVSHGINSIRITMEPGDSVDMIKMFYPGYTGAPSFGSVSCQSSDSGVASVESGKIVTAEKAGTCTLTIAQSDILDKSDNAQRQLITVTVV